MWAAAKTRTFALRSLLHPHPPRSEPSVSLTACWYFGRLALEPGIGTGTWNSMIRIAPVSACLFPCSFLQFPRCLCYLRHGNCARLPAQTQIPPHLSPFASMMTQQLLQGFQPPPSSTSLIHHAHQTKQLFVILSFVPKPDSKIQNTKASNQTLSSGHDFC